MYSGTGVAGRTRSRQGITGKQYFENKCRKHHEVEGIASQEEWCSSDTVSDDGNDDDVILIEDTIPDDEATISDDEDTISDDNSEEDSGRTQPRQALIEKADEIGSQDTEKGDEIGSQEERCPIDTGSSDGGVDLFSIENGEDDEATPHGDDDGRKSRYIAGRTRSHFRPSKFRNTKAGTFSNPLCLDNEEEENETIRSCNLIRQESLHNVQRIPKVTLKRRRKVFDGFKILPEHLHGEGAMLRENSASTSGEEGNPKVMRKRLEVSQPLEKLESVIELDVLWREANKCRRDCDDEDGIPEVTKTSQSSKCTLGLGTKASQPLEKLESENELDVLWGEMAEALRNEGRIPEVTKTCLSSKCTLVTKASQPLEELESEEEYLWDEMDRCLQSCKEDNSVEVENGECEDPCPEGEVSVTTRCARGDHDLIVNEEIGEFCKHCLHLTREIKYIDPQFGKNPSGKSRWRYSPRSEDADDSFSSDPEHESSGCDDNSSGSVIYTSTGTVWDIIPRAKRSMYDHQQEAFEFLWTNLAGGLFLEELEKQLDFAGGSGCIISHAPGTGKTFLTIVFLRAFMSRYPNCRPLIIAPTNILHTWEKELKKWEKVGVPVPFHNLNKPDLSGEETESAIIRLRRHGGRRRRRHGAHKKIEIRGAKVYSWKEATSILGISYNLFDRLSRKGSDDVKKALFELPGLVVLDEGHTPRNDRSLIWEALSKIKTKRRIILSGTPFQNNFKELYNTLRLAKPRFVELKQCTRWNLEFLLKSYDRVDSDREKTQVIAKIRDVIKPFVHVHKGAVLQESLPGLRESVISLNPSQTQMSVFDYIQQLRRIQIQAKEGPSTWFKFEHLMSVASVDPSLLVAELTNLPERERAKLNAILERLESSPEDGVKTKFVMDFIRQSQLRKEKVLIFSQYVAPLVFLANRIKSRFDWKEGEQMMVIHGKTHEVIRQAWIDSFNDPRSKARVMLASTKTCYEGINLVGASRVILLDTLWNPSAERQAVSRAYRIGQKKIVYTYRLITAGTWDQQKLYIQAEKDQLSEMVFFGSNEAGHRQNTSPVGFEDKLLEKMGRQFGTKITKRGVTILFESEK